MIAIHNSNGSQGSYIDVRLEGTTDDPALGAPILLTGNFEWNSTDYSQYWREVVEGFYDPETSIITLNGIEIINGNGVAISSYTATLNPDGTRMLNGSWGADGTFSATRTGEITSRFTENLEGWESE